MQIILVGAPGAGKGTQAASLASELQIAHVASGDLFRDAVKAGTPLGLQAKGYMDKGELVPDDVTIGLVLERLQDQDAAHGVILDGFPRTRRQAEALDDAMTSTGHGIDRVVYLEVPQDVLISRLSGRWICRDCHRSYHELFSQPTTPGVCDACGGTLYQREDDKRETALRRLEVYFKDTAPLIDYYRERGALVNVNGDQSVDDVRRDLMAAVGTNES
ncbi:MAG: adenylate kinase [Chloroflexota bacterium]